MPCGCTSVCGCNIIAGANINVNVLGNNITISSIPFPGSPTFIQMADPGDLGYSYTWQEIDGLGDFVATHVVWVAP